MIEEKTGQNKKQVLLLQLTEEVKEYSFSADKHLKDNYWYEYKLTTIKLNDDISVTNLEVILPHGMKLILSKVLKKHFKTTTLEHLLQDSIF